MILPPSTSEPAPARPTPLRDRPLRDGPPPPPAPAGSRSVRRASLDSSFSEWIAIDDDLPVDHLARVIDEAVDQLDLTPLFASYAGVGSRAQRPDLMLKIALYELQPVIVARSMGARCR